MPTISRELNKHNFIRWVRLKDITLQYLQENGLHADQEEEKTFKCGMRIIITKDDAARRIVAKMSFDYGAYPVMMALETKDGQPVMSYTRTNELSSPALKEGQEYIVKAYAIEDPTCSTQASATIAFICGLSMDIYQNGSSVIIQHAIAEGSYNVEYALFSASNTSDPITGYEWAIRTRWDLKDLPDGEYIAKVQKSGAINCMASKTFRVNTGYVQLLDFGRLNQAQLLSRAQSEPFTLRNRGLGEKTVLMDISSTIANSNITVTQGTEATPYAGRRAIKIAVGGQISIKVSAFNDSGVYRYVKITLQDQDAYSAGLLVVENNKTEYVRKAEATLIIDSEGIIGKEKV